ncbi:MAG: 4Fe-4S binding protein [Candidatus Binatia bacterium]
MVATMDKESFGSCIMCRECQTVCPKGSRRHITM